MQMINQRLQAFFVNEISKITEGIGYDKKENGSTGDDGDFDPFHTGQEGDGEEEDVSREGYKNGDQQGILKKEGECGSIFADGDKYYHDDNQGDDPP